MSKTKRKLSAEETRRIDEHAKRSTEAMRRAASTKRRGAARGAALTPMTGHSDETRLPAKSRRGKKAVVVYLSEEAKTLFARIAADKRLTTQDLGAFAINMMFEHFRHKPIA